jgi:hypothetical protein
MAEFGDEDSMLRGEYLRGSKGRFKPTIQYSLMFVTYIFFCGRLGVSGDIRCFLCSKRAYFGFEARPLLDTHFASRPDVQCCGDRRERLCGLRVRK